MERSCSPGTGMALWQHTLLHQQSWSLILHLMLMTCCVYWYTVFSFPNTWKMSAWFGSQCVWALQKCSAQLLHFGWLKCELCLPTGVCLDFVQTEASKAWEVGKIKLKCNVIWCSPKSNVGNIHSLTKELTNLSTAAYILCQQTSSGKLQ